MAAENRQEKMKCLDLCCGAGGASMGYHMVGFTVVGVDIVEQPHYPFEFHKGDAFEFLSDYGYMFDFIAVSPPCQAYSKATIQWKRSKDYPDLIGKFRETLIQVRKPYVIENVPNSPLINPIFLNGAMFNLLVHRPRYFECNFYVEQPPYQKPKDLLKWGGQSK